MGDAVPDLTCPGCGATHAAGPDEPWRCTCGGPLELAADPTPDGDPPGGLDRDRGLWAFESLLSVDRRVSLGEGWTPLVEALAFDATFKLEYVFPSGSFKDRGATALLSRAAGLGVDTVVEDSSGNAGAAVAQYAARAGVDARIYLPADAKPAKRAAVERVGAEPVPVEGPRQAATDACVAAAEAGEGWYASHAWNPAFFEGTATFGLEVAAQRGWTAPDALVLPAGHGTLLLGAYRGFRRLVDAGWVEELPTLLAAQAAGTAPLVERRHGAAAAAGANDAADGIRITDPVRADAMLAALNETGGDVVAVGREETERTLRRLRRAGFDVEPTCAVPPAALAAFRERGAVAPDDDVVVPLTGSGLKDPG